MGLVADVRVDQGPADQGPVNHKPEDRRAAEDLLVRDKPMNAETLPALPPKPEEHPRALLIQRLGAGGRDGAEAAVGKCRSIMKSNWMT